MLRFIIPYLIVGISFVGNAQGAVYSAKLEVIRLDSVGNPWEVNVDMQAMLVRDGQPIDPQPEYFYEWWREKPNVPSNGSFEILDTAITATGQGHIVISTARSPRVFLITTAGSQFRPSRRQPRWFTQTQ